MNDLEGVASKFHRHCLLDERLSERVSYDYQLIAKKFLEFSKGAVSRNSVRSYLGTYLDKAPKTYNNQLDGLRAFVTRFLGLPAILEGFKKAYVPQNYERSLPTKEQIRKGFTGLTNNQERALYLFYATSGVRKAEALELEKGDIDRQMRCVKPKHDTRTKRGGIAFYNQECARWLDKFETHNGRIFEMGSTRFRKLWNKASESAGFRITPQVLRVWFATEMGELGIPDRYVDAFQGRAPKTVLAKHYTGKGLERLKRIYDKANLKVLT